MLNGGQGRGRRAHARCPAVLRQRGACDVVYSARGAAAVSAPDWVGVVCGLWLVAGASGLVCQAGHPLPPRLLAVWATRLWQDDVRDGTGWCSQAQHLCSHAGEQAVRVGARRGSGSVRLCLCAVHGHGSLPWLWQLHQTVGRRPASNASISADAGVLPCCVLCHKPRAAYRSSACLCCCVLCVCGCVAVCVAALCVAVCVFMTHGSRSCYWRM